MTDIPEEVFRNAETLAVEGRGKWKLVARAIMAERERCRAECQYYIDNIEVSVKGRSRFNDREMNRQAKMAVRYVMDKISGDFDKHWKDPQPQSERDSHEGD